MKKAACSSIILTERDIALMLMVYSLDGCTMEQLRRLFFPTSSGKQACQRRINQLILEDYLDATPIPSPSGLGKRYFLTVGNRARQLIADRWEIPRAQLQRAIPVPSVSQQPHHLAINDFRISLQLAAEQVGMRVEWTSERAWKRTPIKIEATSSAGKSEIIILIPDGMFTLDRQHHFYFEQDMDTHHQGSTRAKLRGYLLHARTMAKLQPILWVCPNQKRLQELSSWAQLEAQHLGADPTIFWIATQEQIDPSYLLQPIWQVIGWAGKCSLTGVTSSATPDQQERFDISQLYALSGGENQ